jgi:hypothetical protein
MMIDEEVAVEFRRFPPRSALVEKRDRLGKRGAVDPDVIRGGVLEPD